MYFNVASNFYYDSLKLLRNLSCENISLLFLTFIKLLERFIKVLAEILSFEVFLRHRQLFIKLGASNGFLIGNLWKTTSCFLEFFVRKENSFSFLKQCFSNIVLRYNVPSVLYTSSQQARFKLL